MACNDNDEYSLGYADQWLRMRDTKLLDRSSTPGSPAAEQDADCDYDEDQSYVSERHEMDGCNQDAAENGDWALKTHGGGSAEDVSKEEHQYFGTVYTELDNQVRSLKGQFYEQDRWNNDMQHAMETMVQRYDEIHAMQEALAVLQATIPEIREAVAALQGNKGKDGVAGRKSKRLP